MTSRTNQKRQIEEEHKTNDHIYFEDLPEVIIENITKLRKMYIQIVVILLKYLALLMLQIFMMILK